MAKDSHWMEKAFSNSHGQLHKELGIDPKHKIPAAALEKAAHAAMPLERRRAQLVINTRKVRAGK